MTGSVGGRLDGPVRALVVAKAPVPGRAKTRLGAEVGPVAAAELAAAALLDTLETCRATYAVEHCHLALAGDLAEGASAAALVAAVEGWTIHPQGGGGFADRLAAAHADVAACGRGPVVQVGMDTPQVTPALLEEVAAGLRTHDAVLGPAEDGGWWVLALREPGAAAALRGVEMSTPTTHDDTRAALVAADLRVAVAPVLRDVDEVADAEAVAGLAPGTRFARAWSAARAGAGA